MFAGACVGLFFMGCGEQSTAAAPLTTSVATTTGVGGHGGSGGASQMASSSGSDSTGFGGGVLTAGGPADSDGDGILDADEGKNSPGGATDTDMDGLPDYLDEDSDDDGLLDKDEGVEDWDNDGIPNFQDSYNDGLAQPVKLTALTTTFSKPIGIDYHEPTNSVVLSANYPTGNPFTLERIDKDGMHSQFSALAGLSDEVKIATARSGNLSGFAAGELFVGNGVEGQVVRISADGTQIQNPWVDLPGNNGLMRGSLFVDNLGIFGGDLIVVTTSGQVWRIDAQGNATQVADAKVHLEGVAVVPNKPARYGPLAGTILAGAEDQNLLYAFKTDGTFDTYDVGVAIEDIDIVLPNENFFGVNYGTAKVIGAEAQAFQSMAGDFLLTQEYPGSVGLYRLKWDPMQKKLLTEELVTTSDSSSIGQWEHVTFAPAGLVEIPEVPVPK